MYIESIDKKTNRILEKIKASGVARDFYLAGGTALTLQLGHRLSIDLDWFSAKPFSALKLKSALARIGKLKIVGEEKGTLHAILDGVKVSFFHYNYKPIFPLVAMDRDNDKKGVMLADKKDIAAMKIDAISSRGSKKDFIDLYFLLQEYSLGDIIGFFEKKYRGIAYNKMHVLKSLTYFDDAEREPMPIMLKRISWAGVKKSIAESVSESLDF
jgi:hypothetical protein